MAKAVNTSTIESGVLADALLYISENLRQADRDEMQAVGVGDPADALVASVEASTLSFLIVDRSGLPIAVFGVAPHGAPGLGIVWLMGTGGVLSEGLSVARQTRRYVEEMQELYPVLWNFVDDRNEVSIRWLQWAGFKIVDAHPAYGPERRLFYEFTRTP